MTQPDGTPVTDRPGSTATALIAPDPTAAETHTAPPRILQPRFTGGGLVFAGLFFAASLSPSLLPRDAIVQGLLSGLTLALGYGIGAAVQEV